MLNNNASSANTPPASGSGMATNTSSTEVSKGVWSQEEHDRFLEALRKYPDGPWKAVAEHVGTRSVRQVQTHAQKYHEKVARRLRGLRKDRKRVQRPEHRIDDEILEICEDLKNDNALLPQKPAGKRQRKVSTPTAKSESPADTTAIEDRNTLDLHEETKLSESMQGVHVEDVHSVADDETESKLVDPTQVVPLTDSHDPAEKSFYECIDYLIAALSSSDSEYESS